MNEPHKWNHYYYKEKDVGLIREDNQVYRTVRTPAHYFRKFDGFAISKALIEDLMSKGVRKIIITRILEDKNIENWESSMTWFIENKEVYMNANDEQYVLNKKYWTRYDKNGYELI